MKWSPRAASYALMATRLGPHLNTQTYIQRSYRVNGKGIANVYTTCVLLGGVYTQQNADLGRYGPKTSPDGPLDRKISNDDDDNDECRLIASDIYLTHNPLYIKSTCNRKTYIFAQKKGRASAPLGICQLSTHSPPMYYSSAAM